MSLSNTFGEDLLANAILGTVMLMFVCARDFCKRVSRSDCVYDTDHGLRVKLPTWHGRGGGGADSSTDQAETV